MKFNTLIEFFKRQKNLPLKAGFIAVIIHYFLVDSSDKSMTNVVLILLLTPSYLVKFLSDFELLNSDTTTTIFSGLVYGFLIGLLFSEIPVVKALGVILIIAFMFACGFIGALVAQAFA